MVWSSLKYFSRNENWGDPDKMQASLLLELDKLRGFIGVPIQINFGTQGQHAANSDHYTGFAVDCSASKMELFDFYIAASRFGFTAIGLYPNWKTEGLHLGMAPSIFRKLWLAVQGANGQQEYIPFSIENLRKYHLF